RRCAEWLVAKYTPGLVQRDQLGDEVVGNAVAVDDPGDGDAHRKGADDVQWYRGCRVCGDADEPYLAVECHRSDERFDYCRDSGSINGVVDTGGDDGPDLFGEGSGGGVDDVGGAKCEGEITSRLVRFDSDDGGAALDDSAHDSRESDRSRSGDEHG